jgi:bifunctional ADP-heptose synthase (sugar kinase/adenylyltransferase)
MEVIDAVVLFNEATPLELIKVIRPSIIAKGGDYNEEEMIGAEYVREYGGKVEILPFVEGYSSSMIIEKIRKSIS